MNLETPFPYQIAGAKWLASKDQALLADDMGLGKSCQAIRAADIVSAKNILVLCPAVARVNWAREFTKFSPFDHPCVVLTTGKDVVPDHGVVICSYDLLSAPSTRKAELLAKKANTKAKKLLAYATEVQEDYGPATANLEAIFAADEALRSADEAKRAIRHKLERKAFVRRLRAIAWDILILDEAHYLKERSTDRTTAVFGINTNDPGLAGSTKRIWRLTGTPAPNDASELWIHLRSAHLITLPYWDFVFHFCEGFDARHGYKITGHKNTDELKAILAPFMLRRLKEDVMQELPPIRFQEVTVERSQVDLESDFFAQIVKAGGQDKLLDELKVADQTLRSALDSISGNDPEDDASLLHLLEGMQPAQATLRRYIAMAKLPAICDLIEEELKTEMLDKIVLFGIHRAVIEGARARLAKYGAVTLYGGTPDAKKQKHIDDFMKDPKCRVFIGNIQAAGTAITLTSACEGAFLEQSWVPSENAQAAMRIHRIGQTKPVRFRIFSLDKSVDQQVQMALMRKIRELTKII